MTANFSYVRPETIQDALVHLQEKGDRLHAGGTDLLTCLRDHVFVVKKIISMKNLGEIKGLKKRPSDGLRIGALTTVTGIAENEWIKRDYPALSQAASEVASPQIRNQGTIGGNLCQKPRCWYYRGEFHCRRKGGDLCYAVKGENQYHCLFGGKGCYIVHPSDTAPALAALGAKLRLIGIDGERTIPVEDFFVLPAHDVTRETVLGKEEILAEILLSPPEDKIYSSYRKVRARQAWDFALAGVALALNYSGGKVEKARIFLSGAAPIPWRSREVEDEIIGSSLDENTITRAAAAGVRNASPLAKNHYKIHLFQGMLEEELHKVKETVI